MPLVNDHKMMLTLAEQLGAAIHAGLPGAVAHQRMAPVTRKVAPVDAQDYPTARKAAVLILISPLDDKPVITLIERPAYEGVHSGQVSFPGGKIEPDDASMLAAALRETQEEIGIESTHIHLIGQLSNVYIPPSNFFVFPFLAYMSTTPVYQPDPHEVSRVFTMPIEHLLDQSAKGFVPIIRPEITFEAPCYIFEDYRIWGATAIMLSELEWLLQV
jgi:8-oxo-dGTP pyrophosphatase MutT (NUDIX family)